MTSQGRSRRSAGRTAAVAGSGTRASSPARRARNWRGATARTRRSRSSRRASASAALTCPAHATWECGTPTRSQTCPRRGRKRSSTTGTQRSAVAAGCTSRTPRLAPASRERNQPPAVLCSSAPRPRRRRPDLPKRDLAGQRPSSFAHPATRSSSTGSQPRTARENRWRAGRTCPSGPDRRAPEKDLNHRHADGLPPYPRPVRPGAARACPAICRYAS